MQAAPSRAASRGRRANQSSAREDQRPFSGRPTKRRPSSANWLGVRDRRRLEHQVAARLGLGEGHHLADVGLLGEERRPAVDPERDPAVRRGPELERVEDGPELLAHPLERMALQQERALEQVAAMDPDRAAAQLPAVERQVVLEGPGATGRVVRRRAGPDRRSW